MADFSGVRFAVERLLDESFVWAPLDERVISSLLFDCFFPECFVCRLRARIRLWLVAR